MDDLDRGTCLFTTTLPPQLKHADTRHCKRRNTRLFFVRVVGLCTCLLFRFYIQRCSLWVFFKVVFWERYAILFGNQQIFLTQLALHNVKYTYVHIQMYEYIYIHACVYKYIYTYTYAYIYIHIYMYIYIIYVYIYVYTYIYIYMYICMYLYICA